MFEPAVFHYSPRNGRVASVSGLCAAGFVPAVAGRVHPGAALLGVDRNDAYEALPVNERIRKAGVA